jgi:hypothetical protein
MASKKKPRLLVDQFKEIVPPERPAFIDKVTPKQREELLALKLAYDAGEIKRDASSIWRYFQEHLKLECSDNTFKRWLRGMR